MTTIWWTHGFKYNIKYFLDEQKYGNSYNHLIFILG